jgi:hypothetical protein
MSDKPTPEQIEWLNQMEQQYKTTIKQEKDRLTEKSLNQYARCLKLLHKSLVGFEPTEDYSFLKDKEKVENFLSKYSPTTQRNYCNAIVAILESEEQLDKPILKYYKGIVKQQNTNYKQQNETGIISDKQAINFNGGIEKVDELIDKLKQQDNKMGYILYRILYHHHIRNEIATLQVISLKAFRRLKPEHKYDYKTEEDRKNDKNRVGKNYLVMGSRKIFIARNGYKTEHKYGEIVFEVTDKLLKKEIKDYVATLKTTEMFPFPIQSKTDKRQQLSNYMNHLSKTHVGLNISTTIMAKIMMSHKYLANKLQQEQTAKERGHSISVENDVYIKAPNPQFEI